MDRQNHSEQEAARFLKETFSYAKQKTEDLRTPYQMMERIKSPDDIDPTITATFDAFERVRKKKFQFDNRLVWSIFGLVLLMFGFVTVKTLLSSVVFICGSSVAMFIFSKAHTARSPLAIEIEAYKAVLMELHKMKIMHEQVGRGSD